MSRAWEPASPPVRRPILPTLSVVLPNVAGAALVYAYFAYVEPSLPGALESPLLDLSVFVTVTAALVVANVLVSRRYFDPLVTWRERLRQGTPADEVPAPIRRRALNAPTFIALMGVISWTLAGFAYFPYQLQVARVGVDEAVRVLLGIVLVAGPTASALAFLVAEFNWRRQIPLFFPQGNLDRTGVVRLPVIVRLGATFLLTAVLPPLLMLLAGLSFHEQLSGALPAGLRPLWLGLLRTQIYIVGATGVASVVMALLVARFINRPVQALRAAMARVSDGDLAAQVPVRSTDELGELNEHFNAMVRELRQAERTRELFGRYVSRAVARQALERGIALGGELTRATAMFADLRGFTALTQRLPPARVVEVLNDYYAIVERVCAEHGGIVTQFLGDGVVVIFGGPLQPAPDHAHRAVSAAVALQRALAARSAPGGARLLAGIGICTGDIIAGNVGSGERVTYTIVGDAVNQAARLQVKTRDLGAPILITESTRAALGETDGLALRSCGAVALKGIAAPVETYAVDA